MPAAAISPSTCPQFSLDQMKGLPREAVRTVEAPRCDNEDDPCQLPCDAPATVTDIETGCTFCPTHFREVIF